MKNKLTKEQKAELALIKKAEEKEEQEKRSWFTSLLGEAICDYGNRLKSDESRLDFLTEIFELTEDIRYDLSESDTAENPMLDNEATLVPCGTFSSEKDSCDGKERGHENNVGGCA